MIQIRDILQAKFGDIDQAVELFTQPKDKKAGFFYMAPQYQFNVLTDISGDMYTLVNEFVANSMGEFEQQRNESFSQEGFSDWFKQFQLFIEGGQREYYNIEGNYSSWSRPGMIIVRETYTAYKWQINEAVSLLKKYGAMLSAFNVGQHPRVLTDASGSMFRAVIEIETESMSAWEMQRRQVFQEPEFKVWFLQLLAAVKSGKHEFYRVEHTSTETDSS